MESKYHVHFNRMWDNPRFKTSQEKNMAEKEKELKEKPQERVTKT